MNKTRSAAYRVLVSGARYHEGKLSALAIGQRRGSLKDLRDDFKKFKRIIERREKERIEYFGTWVHDNNPEKGGWRRHAHIIWTSPETKFKTLLDIFEGITKEHSSLYIDDRVEESRYKLGYALQYAAKQKGESVRYSRSEEWTPIGYDEEWRRIRALHRVMNIPLSDTICELNSWIDRQKAIKHDRSRQTALYDVEDTIGDPHPQRGGSASKECIGRFPFVKRKL